MRASAANMNHRQAIAEWRGFCIGETPVLTPSAARLS